VEKARQLLITHTDDAQLDDSAAATPAVVSHVTSTAPQARSLEGRAIRIRRLRRSALVAAALVILLFSVKDREGLSASTTNVDSAAASSVKTSATPTRPTERPGLLITVSAHRPCWIGTVVDSDQRLERLLQANETLVLHARKTVLLRIGDAGAVTLLINNRQAKPLGAPGQVANRLITQDNFESLVGSF
jgi:hypothetical protein